MQSSEQQVHREMFVKGYSMYAEYDIDSKVVKRIEYWIKFGHTIIVEYLFNGDVCYYKNVDSVI